MDTPKFHDRRKLAALVIRGNLGHQTVPQNAATAQHKPRALKTELREKL